MEKREDAKPGKKRNDGRTKRLAGLATALAKLSIARLTCANHRHQADPERIRVCGSVIRVPGHDFRSHVDGRSDASHRLPHTCVSKGAYTSVPYTYVNTGPHARVKAKGRQRVEVALRSRYSHQFFWCLLALLTWFKFTARASPKSVSFSCQSLVRSMLSGLRSLQSEC